MLHITLLAILAINVIPLLIIAGYFMKKAILKKRLKPTYSLEELKELIPSLDIKELHVLRLIVTEESKRYSSSQLTAIMRLVKIHIMNLTKKGSIEIETYLMMWKLFYKSARSV